MEFPPMVCRCGGPLILKRGRRPPSRVLLLAVGPIINNFASAAARPNVVLLSRVGLDHISLARGQHSPFATELCQMSQH